MYNNVNLDLYNVGLNVELGMKPCIHLVEMSVVTFRLTKIMNNLLEHLKNFGPRMKKNA